MTSRHGCLISLNTEYLQLLTQSGYLQLLIQSDQELIVPTARLAKLTMFCHAAVCVPRADCSAVRQLDTSMQFFLATSPHWTPGIVYDRLKTLIS